MKKNNYFGLKEIKKKGLDRKVLKKDAEKVIKKLPYDEKKAKFLIVKYKKFNNNEAKNDLMKMCYPIIFTVLKRVGNKINTTNMLFNNDDLFNEGILITDKCIKAYKTKYRVKFMTFLWVSLNRGFLRFIDNYMMKPNKIFTSILEHSDDDKESDLEVLESINDKKRYTQDVSSYLKNQDVDLVENDFLSNLTDLETKVIYLKCKHYNNEEITAILEINFSKYYKLLKRVKEKTKRNF